MWPDEQGCTAVPLETFLIFLRLGCTSFGGPVAHLGYFRAEFVERRGWLSEAAFADIVALCQFLPGPASSQVGITIGMTRGGLSGGAAAWLGFTLPSALLMVGFAYGLAALGDPGQAGWLHGLKIVAVAVVAGAVWSMARTLCPDRPRVTLALAAALIALLVPSAAGQIGAIVLGAIAGRLLLPAETAPEHVALTLRIPRGLALSSLAAFFVLLFGLPALAAATGNHVAALVSGFYRAGALVFGGGHVILPLLQRAVVPPGWVPNDLFLAGYGAAQALPGPLSTFAAFLGAVMRQAPSGWLGGLICVIAIYLPSFLLLLGALPFWDALRRRAAIRGALRGVNAAVVGLLLAALYMPVWTSAILRPADFALALTAFVLLTAWRVAPWLAVLGGAAWGALLG
ncbi:MAG: chromate efflux transporter [Alphaproteobacteria bacterium]|nr:chromate efflux transporter [Alphaproteobacteria bacterium]